MHLLSMIALYISAGSLIALLFQYINLYFPDALQPIYYSGVAGTIRWAMASLMIIFPIYLGVTHLLNKEYGENPEKRELKIRKWLVYFTLFVVAIIISTDLVTLVYNFLGGELTARFLLKIISVALVIGTVFLYYGLDLKEKLTKSRLDLFLWGSAAAVLLAIVGGFFTAGSPLKARLYRFDEQRVADLQNLQYQIVEFWIQKQTLPGSLDGLKNDLTGYQPPKDPETNLPYIYKINNNPANQTARGEPVEPAFELCADFNLASYSALNIGRTPVTAPYYESYSQNWDHGQGNRCFSRTIDPELYKTRVGKPTYLEPPGGGSGIIY